MKKHLMRSTRSTWCGRFPSITLTTTRDHREATCQVCLRANEAEQRKEDAASA